MEYLCIIPARAGSNDLPNKNVKQMLGKPLIAWTIQQATATKKIGRTIISTDSHRIAKIGRAFGADVPFERPAKYATDDSTIESVMLHCLAWLNKKQDYTPDAIVLLPCTCPVRHKDSISSAIEQFESTDSDSLVSVSPMSQNIWMESAQGPKAMYNFRVRNEVSQMKPEELRYKENGSIYITRTSILKNGKNRIGGKVTLFKMSQEESFQIDSLVAFGHVEAIMRSQPLF